MGRFMEIMHVLAGMILGSLLILTLVAILSPEAREPIIDLLAQVGFVQRVGGP